VFFFGLPFGQHRQRRGLHTANGLFSAVLFRKSTGSIHTDQPIRFCSTLGRCKQIIIRRAIFQVFKALLDGSILHAADPQPPDGEFASGKGIHTTENRFALTPRIAGIHHIIEFLAAEQFTQNIELRLLGIVYQQFPLNRENRQILKSPVLIAFIVVFRGCILCQMPQTPADHAIPTLQIPVLLPICTDHFCNGFRYARFFCNHQIFQRFLLF